MNGIYKFTDKEGGVVVCVMLSGRAFDITGGSALLGALDIMPIAKPRGKKELLLSF